MRGKRHSDDIRAQVIASLLVGQGVTEVASQYNLDPSVVSRWRSAIPDDQLQVVATKKGEHIERLLFEYLTETLITLKEQTILAREREYVTKQPAGEFAVLHGVMADKAIRLLEAAHRATANGQESSAEP
jgi:transposase-like protein